MYYNCANQQSPGGSEYNDEKPLPIPKACALKRRDIERLLRLYTHGQVVRGGQEDMFQMALGPDPNRDNDAPSMVVLAWEINIVRVELACVVNPGSPHPWLLRIEMTDEYIGLGLHWAGPTANVPWQLFFIGMHDIVNNRPLAATIVFHQSLDEGWQVLLDSLGNHFGVFAGAAMYWWPPCTIPWSMAMDMCDPGPEIVMTDLDNGDVGHNLLCSGRGGRSPPGAFLVEDTAPDLVPASPVARERGSDDDERLRCAILLATLGAPAPFAATSTAIPSLSNPGPAPGTWKQQCNDEEEEIM